MCVFIHSFTHERENEMTKGKKSSIIERKDLKREREREIQEERVSESRMRMLGRERKDVAFS